ncbi:uncharacterized protein LOC116224353 [Clupea harengus]|uniref:Gypsy retrotransposon integrase-like protein 1 n=1 Tax=Clupea harengus TaxID=7950 RepID=A0A6P8GKA9_CLUHA|nr:uncharacterized protein LOC116224353 [Clupea harengus]
MSLIKPTDVISGTVQLSMETAGVMEVHLQPEPPLTIPDQSDIPVDLDGSALCPEQTKEAKTPEDNDSDLVETVCAEVVLACCNAVGVRPSTSEPLDAPNQCPELTSVDWKQAQVDDHVTRTVTKALGRTHLTPAERAVLSQDAMRLLRHRPRLFLKNGVLHRKLPDPKTLAEWHQLVLPPAWRQEAWQLCHEKAGHFGGEKTLHLMQSRFFWVGQAKDILEWSASCPRCVLRKAPTTQTKAPLVPIMK